MPKLRSWGGSSQASSRLRPRLFSGDEESPLVGQSPSLADAYTTGFVDHDDVGFLRGMGSAFRISQVMPLVGSLPPSEDDPGPPALLFGLTGLWE